MNQARGIGSQITKQPSPYAMNKLESLEFIELWYFTPEGCTNTAKSQHSSADDALGLTNIDGLPYFKSISSTKASRNVVADENLDWASLQLGKNGMLQPMAKIPAWVEHGYMAVLSDMYLRLEFHALHRLPGGEGDPILIRYTADTRQDWHETMKCQDEEL